MKGPQKVHSEIDDRIFNQVVNNYSLEIPSSLAKNVLHPYNSFKYLTKDKYFLQLPHQHTYAYVSFSQKKTLFDYDLQLKLYCPFRKSTWTNQVASQSLKNKIMNIIQINTDLPQPKYTSDILSSIYSSKLKTLFFFNNVTHSVKMNGIQNQFQLHHKQLPQRYFLMENYLTRKQDSIEDRYRFLSFLKIEFLSPQTNFTSFYFKKQEFLMQNRFVNLGKCFVKYQIFLQRFKREGEERICIIQMEIMKQKNMKYSLWKLFLGNSDIKLLFQKLSRDLTLQDIESNPIDFLNGLQQLLGVYLVFIRQRFCKIPTIDINIFRFNYYNQQQILLYQKEPWIERFPYNSVNKSPYNTKIGFFHKGPVTPELIYVQLSKIRILKKNITLKNYDCNNLNYASQNSKQLIAITSVYQSRQLSQFIILFYFPLTQRQFITQLNFTDLYRKDTFEQLRCKNIPTWIDVLQNLTIFIGDNDKIYLHMAKLHFTNEFKEILYFQIKELSNYQQVLIIITIHSPKRQIFEQFPSILITKAQDFKLFITLQWVQNQQKFQAAKLDFPELLMGYYKNLKRKSKNNMFAHKFTSSDLREFSRLLVEMVLLNWTSLKQDLLNTLFPCETSFIQRKKMKINTSVQLAQVLENDNYVLMYRVILMRNILVAIFFKKRVCILMQRLDDGKKYLKKIKNKYMENYIPGFRHQLKGQKEELGKKVFTLLRNQMIVDAFNHF